ncbi:MAG: ribosome recycling factor [Candidatus Taylorbacteria bacterium]
MYNFSDFKKKTDGVHDWLKKELGNIRTGQASPQLLDSIEVESYGSKVSLNQIAQVTVEDGKTLRISPWDSSQIKDIEKAILVSNLGLSPRVDETGLRVAFPPLTGERRQELSKVAGAKLEESKISVRNEREKVLKDIQSKEKKGEMTEDDVRKSKSELQKQIDEANKKLLEIKEKKDKEILN